MIAKIVGFDYDALEPDQRRSTEEDAQAIRGLLQRSTEAVVEIGKRLCAVHERIGRNNFQAWLKAEFRWSQSESSKYMTAARRFGQLDCLENFQVCALFELAAPGVPSAAVERSIAEARRGETVTRRRAMEIVSDALPAGAMTPLSHDAVRRLQSALNQMDEQLEALASSLEPADCDALVERLFDVAARLRAARRPSPSPGPRRRRKAIAAG